MNVVVLVLGILLAVALVQALVWIPLMVRWRRRSAAFWEAFDASVAAGETVLLPVQPAVYRGGTGSFSTVRGNARIVLTDRRLLCRKVTGGVVEVPVGRITGARQSKVFLGSVVGGHEHLVVEVDDHSEVGYFVADVPGWIAQLQQLAAR